MDDICLGIFLGVVQGVTEFLPVSSSAHVMIFLRTLNFPCQDKTLNIFLNIGSLLAVIVFFRHQVWKILLGLMNFLTNQKTGDRYFFVTILLSSLPTIIIFGLLEMVFAVDINSTVILSGSMILFAFILYFCDQSPTYKENISRKDSLKAGFVQLISFCPGVSRLGICLSMMRYLKYSREESFRYSMILSIPPVLGACCLELIKIIIGKSIIENWAMVAAGSVSAFILGLITLSIMVKFLKNYTLLPLIIYRILFGSFILAEELFPTLTHRILALLQI
ncbi:MAG: undecaprenyl-diphosphate phosphatase [Holosporaceae bacterium]|jgi:undecaprenyl-diphosphatase|nr:undecaprenyl-diphosphate phosphatase [Holosporaceae bacterium]